MTSKHISHTDLVKSALSLKHTPDCLLCAKHILVAYNLSETANCDFWVAHAASMVSYDHMNVSSLETAPQGEMMSTV